MSYSEFDEGFNYSLDYWRLCDELSVIQAALLTVGTNPSSEEGTYCEAWKPHERPHGYDAAKTAISNALRRGVVKGQLVPIYEYDINGNQCGVIEHSIDFLESRVDVDSLRAWLITRGLKAGFFFPKFNDEAPDYLDASNPRYAPKLAAAVSAWQAVTDSGKKSPKQALEKWLRENAARFGLVDDEGNPVNQAVEDCSKVANWNQSRIGQHGPKNSRALAPRIFCGYAGLVLGLTPRLAIAPLERP